MVDLKTSVAAIERISEDALKAEAPEPYAQLASQMSELEAALREYIQAQTKPGLQRIVKKLETHERLAAEELELVRLWVVGDAESYARLENNVGDWLTELQRIMSELSRTKTDVPDVTRAVHLRGLLQDAIRVASDLQHYHEHKARVHLFTKSTQELDQEERTVLLGILRRKLASPDF